MGNRVAAAVIYWAILIVAVAILPEMPGCVGTALHWIALVGLGVGYAMSCLTGWRYTMALSG